MQDLPQSRADAVLQARSGHFAVLRELLPYVWPADRPDLRWRVVFALLALEDLQGVSGRLAMSSQLLA